MENKGIIERIQSDFNKKHIEIVLLSGAEPIIKEGIKAQKEFAHNVLKGLTEEEKHTCKYVFDKICSNADEYLKKHTEWNDEKVILCKEKNAFADCRDRMADCRIQCCKAGYNIIFYDR